MAKSKTKLQKVVVSEPRILLLGHKTVGEVAKFASVHVGTPFVHKNGHVFLKVGKTTAMCLFAPEAETVKGVVGAKVTFRSTEKVEPAAADISFMLVGGPKKPLQSPGISYMTADTAQTSEPSEPSDIAASVLARAA